MRDFYAIPDTKITAEDRASVKDLFLGDYPAQLRTIIDGVHKIVEDHNETLSFREKAILVSAEGTIEGYLRARQSARLEVE